MIYRVDYDSDMYKAVYIAALQLIKIMKGKEHGKSLADNWIDVSGTLVLKVMKSQILLFGINR